MKVVNNVHIKLMEECGELTQAVAKVVKYDTPEARHHLAEEAGDVLAFVYLMQEAGLISENVMNEKRKATILKYRELFYGGGYKRLI